MRTWGRVATTAEYSSAIGYFDIAFSPIEATTSTQVSYNWVEVTTDSNGYNDAVWLTTLAQVLQLNVNESPFYGNYGIPSQQSVTTQVFPDYYVMLTQQNFSQYFLSLLISKQNAIDPTYNVNATANPGAILINPVPI